MQADLALRGMDLYELKARQFSAAFDGLVRNDPESSSAKSMGSDGWSRTDHLLAMVVDELRVANWQRTKDGSKNRKRPKPISPLAERSGIRIGRTDKSPEQVIDFLDRLHKRGKYAEEEFASVLGDEEEVASGD